MQPAATLRVLVDADVAKATAQIAAFDKTLGLSAKRAAVATKSYDKLGAATKGASGQLSLFDKNLVSTADSLVTVGDESERTSARLTKSFSRVKTAAKATTHEFHRNEKAILTLGRIPGALAGIGALTEALTAAAGGAAALTGALAPLTGLAASGAQALTLYGQVAGTIALAGVDDLGAAVGGLNEKLDEEAEAFKKLSPNAQEFARELEMAKKPLRDIQRGVQGRLFGNLDIALEGAMRGLQNMRPILNQTADSIGAVAVQFSKWVGSDAFARDLTKIGESNNRVLRQLGGSLLRVSKAFVDVVVAARPLTEWIGRLFERWSMGMRDAAQAGRSSGSLAKFFRQTKDVTQDLIGIFKNVWGALRNILSLGAPLGREILDRLRIGARHLREWTETAEGRNSIKEFFETIRRPLFEAGRLLAEFTKSFFRVGQESSGTLAPLLKAIRVDLLPLFEKLVISTSKAFGPKIVELLTELTKHFLKLAGTSGPLNVWVETMTHITRGLNWLIANIPGFNELIISLLGFKAVASAMGLTAKVLPGLNALLGVLGTRLGTVYGTFVAMRGGGVIKAATAAVAAFGVSLRTAFIASGIGAVITAIVLLNEKFHFLGPVLKAIEGAAKDAFGWLKGAFEKLKPVINAVWGAIKTGAKVAFDVLKTFALPIILQVKAAFWAIKNVVIPVFNFIKDQVIRPVFGWIGRAVGDVVGAFKDAWRGVGGFFEDLFNGILRVFGDTMSFLLGGISTVTGAIADMLGGLGGIEIFGVDLVPGADAASEALQSVTDSINGTRESLDKLGEQQREFTKKEVRGFVQGHTQMAEVNERTQGKIATDTKKGQKDAADSTSKHQKRAADVSENQSGRAMRTVIENNDRMVNAVGRGHKILVENTSKAMKAFGARAVSFNVHIRESNEAKGPGMRTNQAGGFAGVVPGSGSGDKVHMQALVEPGEGVFVLNRNAMGALQSLNAAVPRFQTGGLAPGAERLAKIFSSRFGGGVSSGLRPGDSGFHGSGQAIDWVGGDWAGAARYANQIGPSLLEGIYNGRMGGPPVSWDSGSQVPSSFWGGGTWGDHGDHIHLAAAAAGAFGPVMKRIARVILTSSVVKRRRGGPMVRMGQGSLDKVWKAANARLRRAGTPTSPNVGAGAMSRGEIARVWQQANKRLGNSRLMAAIALAESSGVPTAVGYDPGGTQGLGLWQVTTGFNDDLIRKYGGRNAMFDPYRNAQAAGDIFARQGLNAWVVYKTGAYLQHMQEGGAVGPTAGGSGTGIKGLRSKTGRLSDRLKKTLHKIARLDEEISIQEALAGAVSGPGGTEITGGERAHQITLLSSLLSRLQAAGRIATEGFKLTKRGMGLKGLSKAERGRYRALNQSFRDTRTEMLGLTGGGGRVFETSLALRDLRATAATAGLGGLSISQLLEIASIARLGLYGGSAPVSPRGGIVSSPATASAPMSSPSVASAGFPADASFNIYIGGEKIAEHVRLEVAQTNRTSHGSYRAGRI